MQQEFYKMTLQLGYVSLAFILIAYCEAKQVMQFTKDGYNKTLDSSPGDLKDSTSYYVPRYGTAEPSDSTSTESTVALWNSASTDSTDESCNSFVGNFSGGTPGSSSPVAPNATSIPSNQSHDEMTLSTTIPNSNGTKHSSHSSSEQIYTWRNLLQENNQEWGKNYPLYRKHFYVASYKRSVHDSTSKLLLVGGLDSDGSELNDTWIYTPWTNSWLEVTAGSRLSPVHARGYQVLPTMCQTLVPLINIIGEVWLFDGSTETWSTNPLHVFSLPTSVSNTKDFSIEGIVALRHSCTFSNCSCSETVFAYGRVPIVPGKLRLSRLHCLMNQDRRLRCHYGLNFELWRDIELKVDQSRCSGEVFSSYGIMSAADHDRGIIYFFSRRLSWDSRVSHQTTFFKYNVQRDTTLSQVIYHSHALSFSNVVLWNNSQLLLFDASCLLAVSLENSSRYEWLDINRPDYDVLRDTASPGDVIWAMESLLPVRFHWFHSSKPYVSLYHVSKISKGYFPSFLLTMKAFPPQPSPGVLRYYTSVYDYDLKTFYVYGGRRYDHGQELINTSAAILWTLSLPSYTWWLIKSSTTPTSYMSNCATYGKSNVILFGGQYDDGRVGDELWIYNTKRRVWTQSISDSINNSWPNSRASCSLTTFSSKATVVLYGGYSTAGKALSDVWLLRFHANSTAEWRVKSSTLKDSTENIPLPRFGHSTIVVGSEMVIYGGKSNRLGGRGYIYLSDMWAFSIESKTWREINLVPRQQFIRNWKLCSIADTSNSNSFLLPYGTSKILVLESIFDKSAFRITDSFWIVDTISEKVKELKLLNISLAPQAAGIWNGSFIYYGQYTTEIQQGTLLAIGQKCVPGSAQLRVPTGPCLPCPTGQHYVSHLTVDTCVRCPPGTTTKRSGSTLMKNCTCDMNYCAYGTCVILEIEGKGITAVCRCSFGFLGQQCNQVNFVVFVLAFGLLTVVVTVTTVLFCCGIKIVRHRRARRQAEWELEETRRVFTISPKEIELICRLDEDCPGGYGRVYKAIYRDWTVAVKQLQVDMAEWVDIRKEFLREIQFMRTVRHPNIVMFIGAGQYDDHHPFLILELLVGGALRSLLQNSEIELTRKDNHQFMLDIAEGMKYLHTLRPPRIHRDLKSANLLLSKRWQVKVADFGSARLIPRQDQANARQRYSNMSNNRREEGCESLLDEGSHLTNRRIGTPRWRSPEMWKMKPYGTATDVYSFGIVVWEIVTRQTPFTGPAYRFDAKVEDAVLSGTRPTIPDNTPQHLRCLIQQCWQENAKGRPTFSDILLQLQSMVDTLQQPDIHDDLAPCHNLPAEASIELMGLPCRDAVGTCNIQGELTEIVELYNRQHKDGDVTTTTVW